MAAVILAVVSVNILTGWRDQPRFERWEIPVWELSSAVASLILLPGIGWAAWRFPVRRDRLVTSLPALLLASVVFSAGHVTVFLLIRRAVYALQGATYLYGDFGDYIYEYRKDVLGFAGAVALFNLVAARLRPAPSAPAERAVFDIQDGARLIRSPLDEILAVTSAGNYVEFLLADGRRPLMRSTLAAIEVELGPRGFVRTHRSWLVNGARVRVIEPEGSGDFRLELDGGVAAPLSRRFRPALEALRA